VKKHDVGKAKTKEVDVSSEPRTNSLIRNIKSGRVRLLMSARMIMKNVSVY
jgi:hypothetical protein